MADDPEAGIKSYVEHDQAVMRRINRFIALENSKYMSSTIAKKLEYAWSDNITEREIDATHSQDTVGRDADCYFASRHSIAALHGKFEKEGESIAGTVATPVYIGLKSIFKAASSVAGSVGWSQLSEDLDKVMRSNKNLPNAPPGGFVWEQRGAADGKLDLGSRVAPALFHHPK
jgi:hypothetical protein